MNISATIDRKITARYVFENTKYEIALICFLYSWYDLNIKYNPKISDSMRYTIPNWRIGASNNEVNTVAHEYIPINIDVLLYDSWVGNMGKFASL